ncbi:target of Myb protein 1-like isoform X2 [Girardinichthys multiradiatus]|uniref:target of Myb protein 1-like isoform X2 n=1 Tax=Girardinichthys multiradiatus TaxID=208333 RepID=UPI001FAC4DB3|nr:target of Myb protein 1-like isoform X2 [Girardinichthys multiradiatus]
MLPKGLCFLWISLRCLHGAEILAAAAGRSYNALTLLQPATDEEQAAFPLKPDALSAPLWRKLCSSSSSGARGRWTLSPPTTMEFLLGNPFSSPVGQRIERATNSSSPSEDWELNMEICDIVNSSEEGPRDAVRAIKKRIVANKNFKEIMLTLTVLETCVKNCGYRFHILVTTRDFIEGVLVRSIIPRNNPPQVVHDRVLAIIQAWADAFRSSPDLTGVVSVYEDLRRKGLEFPVAQLDDYFLAQAPKKTIPENGPTVTAFPAVRLSSKPLIPAHTSELKLALEGTGVFTPSQVKMLKTELGVVRNNLSTMSDMMSQLDPVTVKQADMELLELYTVCKEMQDRIVKIIPRLSEEKLIEELLATNDEMNTAFTRYHRFERRLTNGQSTEQKSPSYVNLSDFDSSINQSGFTSVKSDSSLSLSKPDSLSSQMAKLSTSESDDMLSQKINFSSQQRLSSMNEVTVDGLAQAKERSLQTTGLDESPSSTRSSSPKLDWMIKRGMIPINQSNVMDDIEKWLALEDEYDDFEDSDGVTSEEFDRFLAERAKAAERLPSLRGSSQDANYSES